MAIFNDRTEHLPDVDSAIQLYAGQVQVRRTGDDLGLIRSRFVIETLPCSLGRLH